MKNLNKAKIASAIALVGALVAGSAEAGSVTYSLCTMTPAQQKAVLHRLAGAKDTDMLINLSIQNNPISKNMLGPMCTFIDIAGKPQVLDVANPSNSKCIAGIQGALVAMVNGPRLGFLQPLLSTASYKMPLSDVTCKR